MILNVDLIGTPQTGGYGITLTAANTVIYYSNGYDLEKDYNQKIERTYWSKKSSDLCRSDLLGNRGEKLCLRNKINIASEVLGEN